MTSRPRAIAAGSRSTALLLLPFALAACAGEDASDASMGGTEAATDAPITLAGVGFATPESMLHDTDADVYLVSNINGAPLAADDNGFISRIAPDGEVLDLKWIDGESEEVTLSAPKGMAIQGGLLYVTDIDCIRMFDAESGSPEGEICIEGASFLNDLVAHPEAGVIFTDTGVDAAFAPMGTDAVYHMVGDRYATIIADAGLGGPNGVAVTQDAVTVVTYFSGEAFTVDMEQTRTDLLAVEGAQFDGVEILDDGRILVSDWGASCVHAIGADGVPSCLFTDLPNPADIGVDRTRNRVLIPLFSDDEVRILPIG